MDYSQLRGRIQLWNNSIPSSHFDNLLNSSLRMIYDSNKWGFLLDSSATLTVPKLLAGTVTVTRYNRVVNVPTGDFKTIIDAITPDEVSFIGRQFRVLGGQTAPYKIYTITAYDDITGDITLDVPYLELSGSVDCKIFKAYFDVPQRDINPTGSPILVNDFAKFEAVIDLRDQRRLSLDTSLTKVNRSDPARLYYGALPMALIANGMSSSGFPRFELYPYYMDSANDKVYQLIYNRNGLDFTLDSDSLPYYINADLILEGAKIKACEWAEANKGSYTTLQKTNWLGLKATLMAPSTSPMGALGYDRLLETAFKKDEEMFPQANINTFMDYPYYDINRLDYRWNREFQFINEEVWA